MAATIIQLQPPARFEFQLEGDETVWSLPAYNNLPLDIIRKLREPGADADDIALDFFEAECPGLLERIDLGTYNAINKAWTEAAGVTLGE